MDMKLPGGGWGNIWLPSGGRVDWDFGGHVNPLQYSCLENPMDRGAYQALVGEITESDTTEQLQFHFLSFEISRGKLEHIEWINNKILLYSIENYI